MAPTIKLPVPASLAWLRKRESAALDERTPRSAEMFLRAGQVLAGGVASSFQAREPWPIYLRRGEGQRVWDVDGNELFDFYNGFSSMLQGHAHPAIGAAVSGRYEHGTHFAAPTEDAVVVAEELSRRWGLPRWRFTNSGTESVMAAIRIARGLSGRTDVVKIFGSYHGHADATMVSIGVEPELMGPHGAPQLGCGHGDVEGGPRVVQVEADDAGRALEEAGGEIAQGVVGAGTGMICFDYKGGIGSASRIAKGGACVGVLVLANFGSQPELRVDGVPVGRLLGSESPAAGPARPAGSCIAVVATDAPLNSAQLVRLAGRAGLGLARTGSVAHHGSGEIFLAFSTTARSPAAEYGGDLDPLFSATVDATEEAVLNTLWSAERTEGREGRVVEALPHDDVLELLAVHRRLER